MQTIMQLIIEESPQPGSPGTIPASLGIAQDANAHKNREE